MPLLTVTSKEEFYSKCQMQGLVVIDFYADWCGPCRMLSSKLMKMAEENPEVIFLKVNVDDLEEVSCKFDVTSIPTIVICKNNEEVERIIGANADEIKAAILKSKTESFNVKKT